MRWFPIRSLRLKLILLAAVSAGVAVLLACISFIVSDLALMGSAKRRQLEAQADMLSLASASHVVRHDQVGAQQLLSKLANHPSIDAAALYDAEGRKIAEFRRTGQAPFSAAIGKGQERDLSNSRSLEHVDQVVAPQGVVGTLILRANMDDIHRQLADYRLIVVWVVGCSMLVATALAGVLQGRISRPILDLARAADQITERDDYSLRVVPPSEDVTGHLYVAFNQMLDRIEASDRALLVAHDDLEQRVADRTAELSQEIAERKRIQDDLVRAKDAAESASRAKSDFLANMSHEIRTPLNAILGFADLLRRGMETSEADQREYLETIHKSGGHLLGVINDILDLSKIEAGQLQIEQLRCCPVQIIAEAISVLGGRAREKSLSLECQWSGPVPESIVTDPARLRQILLNVIGNAIKFTEEGGIQVVPQIIPADTPKLVIDVIDTGIGIPQEKLTQVFEPFCQADTSVTRRFGGTGLGLTICRRLARALGGGISVQSDVGNGSIFTIAIDAGAIARYRPTGGMDIADCGLQIADFAANPQSAISNPQSLAGRRILVADDGDSNRRLIQIVLGRAGAEVITARNGRQAVEMAARERFDLILMDMQMPVMDGYAATSEIHDSGIETPIIALTAHVMKGDREKCLAAGCKDYLTKPIDLDRLAASVTQWLSGGPLPSADERRLVEKTAPDAPLASTLPNDDPEFREIVAEFVGRFHEKLAEMNAALAGSKYAELRLLAHWLKGAGGTAGFAALTTVAGRLEQAAADRNSAGLRAGLAELDGLAARIDSALDADGSRLTAPGL